MAVKWGGAVPRAGKVDKQRRQLLKLAAAGTAGLITSPWTFQSSRAAPKTIKIGQITPETGPDSRMRMHSRLAVSSWNRPPVDWTTRNVPLNPSALMRSPMSVR